MEQIEGITLSVSHYKDKDAILNILTKNGLVAVLGRGIFDQKKPLRVFTSPFLKANFEIYKGKVGGYKLKDGSILKFYNEDYLNFNLLSSLNFISELTLKTIDGIDDFEKLYVLLENTLDNISSNFSKFYLTEYFLKLLKLLGLKILINKVEGSYFDLKSGCFNSNEEYTDYFNLDEITFINNVLNEKNDIFDQNEVNNDKILVNLNYFLSNFTDVKLNSVNLLI